MRARGAGREPARDGQDVLRDLCQAVFTGEGVTTAEVSIAYAGDDLLRQLNQRYRGIDRATDVLSFAYEDLLDAENGRYLSGDVVISVPRVLAQAERYRVTPGRELARLATHGFLHLCGHDHVKLGERKRMRARERIHLDALDETDEQALTELVVAWHEEDA